MTHVSDLVVLGEAVVVEDGEPQRLVEGVRVGKVLELELGRIHIGFSFGFELSRQNDGPPVG